MSDNNNSAKEAHTFDDLYSNRFFKASQMQGRNVTLTIADVWTEELEGEKGADRKAILAFRETDRQLVLPKINGVCIRAMFGGNVKAWAGKRVTFFPTDQLMPMPTARGSDRICVRVYGSPDISEEQRVEYSPPRRRKIVMIMHPTGKPAATTEEK